MSGPVGVGGFEEGEFEGDGPLEKVAAQILLRGADPVQLRAQEIDESAPHEASTAGAQRRRPRLAPPARPAAGAAAPRNVRAGGADACVAPSSPPPRAGPRPPPPGVTYQAPQATAHSRPPKRPF